MRLEPRRSGDPRVTLLDVLRASPHRVAAPCPHFGPASHPGPCGGCTWQHISYAEQLRLKTALVQRLVTDVARKAPVAATLPAVATDYPWAFRHKVHFVAGQTGRENRPALGHYVRGTRRFLPVHECPVHDERGNAFAFGLLRELPRAARSRGAGTSLRHVVVRAAAFTNELMATLVVAHDGDPALRAATRRTLAAKAPTSCHLNVHPREDAWLFGRETRRLAGSERMREEVGGVSFLISPTTFFQTNVKAAEILVRLVLDAIPRGVSVLDLYAGAGLFALPLARRGHAVVAVEESRDAVADGRASLDLNRISSTQCRFIPGRAGAMLRRVRHRDADAVVLDPPRDGCEPEVLDEVFGRLRPARAVYVSCNPEALARDLAEIVRCDYEIVSIQPVDMFPHTPHVEAVAVLHARSRP